MWLGLLFGLFLGRLGFERVQLSPNKFVDQSKGVPLPFLRALAYFAFMFLFCAAEFLKKVFCFWIFGFWADS